MFDIETNRELLGKVFGAWQTQLHIYQKMYRYYCGVTDTNASEYTLYGNGLNDNTIMDADVIGNYSYMNDRNDKRIDTNLMKNFIKTEVSYSVGQNITLISHSGDDSIIDTVETSLAHWKEDHENDLCKQMLIYSTTYELYYINADGQFCSKIISPRHGVAYTDSEDNIIFFLHITRDVFSADMNIDIYTKDEIIHCNQAFKEQGRQPHIFGKVPVGTACVSDEGWLDTIYKDIKSLQDAYENNISDCSQEIGEFRDAYLCTNNYQIKEEDLPNIKKMGIIATTGDKTSTSWLTKNLNDGYMSFMLKTLEEKMYQVANHINPNEKLQSNTSSLSIRARLISLEQKCKLNEKALTNCMKTRYQMLFIYLNGLKGTNYNYLDIKSKFTPNIPTDITAISTMISVLGDKLSLETGLSMLNIVDNVPEEVARIKAEMKANSVGDSLLNPPIEEVKPVVVAK